MTMSHEYHSRIKGLYAMKREKVGKTEEKRKKGIT